MVSAALGVFPKVLLAELRHSIVPLKGPYCCGEGATALVMSSGRNSRFAPFSGNLQAHSHSRELLPSSTGKARVTCHCKAFLKHGFMFLYSK